MTRKKEEKIEVQRKEWGGPGEEKRVGISTDLGKPKDRIVITTSSDRPPRGKGKLLTTRDLPAELPIMKNKENQK